MIDAAIYRPGTARYRRIVGIRERQWGGGAKY